MTAPTAHHHAHGPANRRRHVLETAAPLHVVRPAGPIRGGVVVLHDLDGLTEHIERYCRYLADEGWLAAAPYHYYESGGRAGSNPQVPEYARHGLTPEGLRTDLAAALHYLERRCGAAAESVSVLGFGMGGYLAAWAGAHHRLAAAVSVAPDGTGFAGMPPLHTLVAPRFTPWLEASEDAAWPVIRPFLAAPGRAE